MKQHTPKWRHDAYMDIIRTDDLRCGIRNMVSVIKKANLQFDAIAFCGVSGSLYAPILALRLRKHLILVRKPKKVSAEWHSRLQVEGDLGARTYIIVDDFISSGETVRYVAREIRKVTKKPKCVGIVLAKRAFVIDPAKHGIWVDRVAGEDEVDDLGDPYKKPQDPMPSLAKSKPRDAFNITPEEYSLSETPSNNPPTDEIPF